MKVYGDDWGDSVLALPAKIASIDKESTRLELIKSCDENFKRIQRPSCK